MHPHSRIDLPFPKVGELLGGGDARAFFADTWEKEPRLFRASPESPRSSFLRDDWREMARLVSLLNDGGVEVIVNGRPRKPSTEAEIDECFAAGASVRVFKVQRAWPFLQGLLRDMELETGFRFSANLYVTPAEQQGLGHHSDSHDVFVVQMSGAKRWEIFESPFPLPVEYRAALVFEEGVKRDHRGDEFGGRGYTKDQAGAPKLELTTEPGDLLYIPRGFIHRAFTSTGVSAHVTIGCHAMTWGDLMALATAQETRREPSLRETLPPGALRRALAGEYVEGELRSRAARLFERLHGEGLMLETAARFGAALTPEPDPRTTTAPAETASAPTFVRLAPSAYVSFGPLAIEVRSLRAPARVQAFPLSFRPVFESLMRGQAISPNEFPAATRRGREILTSRLTEAGLLLDADA